MTLILLNALLPIFVGLLLGYIAGRRGVMDNLNVQNLIVLVMDFAIPCDAVLHDQQDILACARRTIGTSSDDRCGIRGFVCCQLCLGKEEASKCPFPMPLYLH